MRVIIAAVGKLKPGPEKQLVDLYLTRCRAQGRLCGIGAVDVKQVPESRLNSVQERCREESEKLLSVLDGDAIRVVLDEHGEKLQSLKLSERVARWRDNGCGELAFLIGGPDGHGELVKSRANFSLSLGEMTWPHKLAQVMIVEQIYRSLTILTNHPYHRA